MSTRGSSARLVDTAVNGTGLHTSGSPVHAGETSDIDTFGDNDSVASQTVVPAP
ncbi:hypothetical protein [Nocardia nepalensis]|uniref:hypothetical protein n=1 Tax=Nocardia nepalensis TaxID=3375448 RepID=UPI003B6748FC